VGPRRSPPPHGPRAGPDDPKKSDRSSLDEKWQARKEFRRANGLCFTCGEKWDKKHKCPEQVSISVIQELLELFQLEDSSDLTSSDNEDDQSVMAVTPLPPAPAVAVPRKRRTMRFRDFIGKLELLILLDSGSAGTFISQDVATSLSQSVQPCEPLQLSSADGSPMMSTEFIPQLQWCIQGHSFAYDARVLPIKEFDLILGADWLEDHSPMWLHRKKKVMRIPHNGRRIQLQGLQDDTSRCFKVSSHKLKGLLKRKAVTHCVKITTRALVCGVAVAGRP